MALFGVYYSMTNGGIIEGQMGVNPCSDLSSAVYFGSEEIRGNKQKFASYASPCKFGGICTGVPPRSHYFMKYLLAITMTTVVGAYAENPRYGFDRELNAKIIANYQRSNAELEESINRKNMEYEMGRQTRELQEQTRLLRKIADQ